MKTFLTFFLILINCLAIPAQNSQRGKVSIITVDAPQLGGDRTIRIYLPEGYEKSKIKYPVIYMHDAQNLFDAKTSYAGEWNVDETLDSLHAKVIVVGIDHGNEKRLDELTPFPNQKHGGGKAVLYLEFLVKTLKPYIDKNFRTKRKANYTAIIGSSLGGLTSFYAVIKYPEVFGKAGILSPSFWYSEEIYKLAEKQNKFRSKMYFLAGDSESDNMVSDLDRMASIVEKSSNHHKIRKEIIKGGKHNEKLWSQNFANVYLWLFGNNFF